MIREFIMMPEFDKMWAKMGLNDEELKSLQLEILSNPKSGEVIRGTGRLRKMRFALEGKGKSSSIRVLYVDFVIFEKVYLITAYPKSQKDNLSEAERNDIKKLIALLEKTLKQGRLNR
ncbi:type II toxin-antitoxin system RelE/ParE family toxin [Candidatus Contubernalis alkaliaceticus]|uniref:type II toxin-antitoxin system RelE/ParE family toxin n=1 Tax=Candidatus Contubernalis alkaliaceticus TaxID=338645 RepID=UPI001F4BD0CE|nr:type II toxin-antitoxin system RelE/ParE family toxin [Candidatus Contubernalis alkalaceticus]UNC93511.1 type II toxin-antitoxin system RelE/ParE family toxin [Candidatus Contubernalis alkalaceticus]